MEHINQKDVRGQPELPSDWSGFRKERLGSPITDIEQVRSKKKAFILL